MVEFDKNGVYLWAIIALGLAIPTLLCAFASLRALRARQRLQRLEASEAQ